MSARRAARDHRPAPVHVPAGSMPAALRVGMCAEVWASDDTNGQPARLVPRYRSTRQRFQNALRYWQREHSGDRAIWGFWSLDDGDQLAIGRLAALGLTVDDLSRLRDEATELLARVELAERDASA